MFERLKNVQEVAYFPRAGFPAESPRVPELRPVGWFLEGALSRVLPMVWLTTLVIKAVGEIKQRQQGERKLRVIITRVPAHLAESSEGTRGFYRGNPSREPKSIEKKHGFPIQIPSLSFPY